MNIILKIKNKNIAIDLKGNKTDYYYKYLKERIL